MELEHFEKTNGQDAEFMGVRVYNMYFDADIAFQLATLWREPTPLERMGGSVELFRLRPATEQSIFSSFEGYRPVDAGQVLNVSGIVHFEKTEKGWVPQGYEIAEVEFRQ